MLSGVLLNWASRTKLAIPYFVPSETKTRKDRTELARRVQSLWIDAYLNQSLYNGVFLSLKLIIETTNNIRCQHVDLEKVRVDSASANTIESGQQFSETYKKNHRMVITGKPGAGKTTLISELARRLLIEARYNPSIPIPVVLMLSSWPGTQMQFDDWVIDELRRNYGNDISSELARYWLVQGEIALFLDGLDELPWERQISAVKAICGYQKSGLDRWFVVCSRILTLVELDRVGSGFDSIATACIQPLTLPQILDYLGQFPGPLPEQFGATLEVDNSLREICDIPLALNLILQSFSCPNWKVMSAIDDVVALRFLILETYLSGMLVRLRCSRTYDGSFAHFLR